MQIHIFLQIENRKLALKYKRSRRNKLPAVYNLNRLREKPLPITRPEPTRNEQSTTSNLSNVSNLDTPPNSPLPAIVEEEDQAVGTADIGSDISLSEEKNQENQGGVETLNRAAGDVVCLSDSVHASLHRPMHFDIISGRYSFEYTVISKTMIFYTIEIQLSVIFFTE